VGRLQIQTARAVLITGTSSGIGRACALELDRLGFQVFAGVRQEGDGQALRRDASERLTPILLDVTDAGSLAAASEAVSARLEQHGLYGLVNNAGMAAWGPLEFAPLEQFRRQLEVNLTGQLAMIQACLPLLRSQRGRIVNIGSISGVVAVPFLGAYSATKFALEALGDALRVELRPWGITVTTIEAGQIETPIWRKAQRSFEDSRHILPPDALHYYGPVLDALLQRASRPHGDSPRVVARIVARALTARRPRTRYLVGRGTRRRRWLRLLPDRIRDWVLQKRIPRYGFVDA
jgi:NAD(P)-dependent dehydrogenase (short-subunit alcohol dehydrogenase family)